MSELSDWYTIELLFKAASEAEAKAFCDLVADQVWDPDGPLGEMGAAVSMTRHPVEDWQDD